MEIYLKNESPEKILSQSKEVCLDTKPPFDLQGIERQIAELELVNALFFKFGEKAVPMLRREYPEQTERVKKFYSSE